MYPSTNTRSISAEKLTISTESTTITASTLSLLTWYGLYTTLKEILARFNENFDKQHEELVNLTTMSLRLAEDTKAHKFSSKLDE